MASMVVYLFPRWEELSAALATTPNHKVDMFDYPIGSPSEELWVEGGGTHVQYIVIWERLRRGDMSDAERELLDKVALFRSDWEQVPGTTLKSGKTLFKWEGTQRIELPLTPTPMFDGDVYIDNAWSFLDCALSPQSVREICELGKRFDLEIYEERFNTLNRRASLFKDNDPDDPSEDFENFKRYYASWHACIMEAARENCGLLVFCW